MQLLTLSTPSERRSQLGDRGYTYANKDPWSMTAGTLNTLCSAVDSLGSNPQLDILWSQQSQLSITVQYRQDFLADRGFQPQQYLHLSVRLWRLLNWMVCIVSNQNIKGGVTSHLNWHSKDTPISPKAPHHVRAAHRYVTPPGAHDTCEHSSYAQWVL